MIFSERSQELQEGAPVERDAARPVFDLVSFAIPARWRNQYNEADRVVAERNFHTEMNTALRPFLDQLPMGAALVAEHYCAPTGTGAMSIRSRLGLQLPDRLLGDRT